MPYFKVIRQGEVVGVRCKDTDQGILDVFGENCEVVEVERNEALRAMLKRLEAMLAKLITTPGGRLYGSFISPETFDLTIENIK